MKRSAHAWEQPGWKRRWDPAAAAELRDDAGFWGEPSDDDSDDSGDEDSPPQKLVSHLLQLHLCNKISASDCCTSMFYAAQAGIEAASKYAMNPGSSSGHCSRKLKAAMGLVKSLDLYEFEVPGHSKHDLSRSPQKVWSLPAHEQIAKDLESDAALRTKLHELRRDRSLPPAYWDHPIVKKHKDRDVLPVAIYIDAVPYSLNDSVIGFWLVCLISNRRYLWGLLRKSHTCRCGCRGWCSFVACFQLGAWSLRALADASFPRARHDDSAWRPTDAARKGFQGRPIRMPCACLYIKGDWSEFTGTLGLPSWQDGLRPCLLCSACGTDMFTAAGNTSSNLRWDENSEGDYCRACDSCSISVCLPTDVHRDELVQKLRYDKRQAGSHGRALVEGISSLRLAASDRLEPSPTLWDVGELENLETPCSVGFWRPSSESLARHRNPLVATDLGMDPARALTVDVLHAVHLGVLKVWAKVALWTSLLSGIYGDIGSGEESLQIAILAFRGALMGWYKRRHSECPAENLTRVADFTQKMVGTPGAQVLKTKGAETYGVMEFLIWQFRQYRCRLGTDWQRLLRAGEAMDSIICIWHEHKGTWLVPPAARKDTTPRGTAS